MKKLLAISSVAILLLLAACHHGQCAAKPLHILATTFPVYQFTTNTCSKADNVDVDLLIPASAGCPHDFSLKPADLKKLAEADVIVINGAGLEEFLSKPLAGLDRKPKIIDAGKNVPVLDDDESAHDHVNPHIFASPANAALMVANIATGLAELDPSNIPAYNQNATVYAAKLNKLSDRLKDVGKKAKNRGIALEHEALAYLAQNADLDIIAMFENSASASQLAQLQRTLAEKKPALLAGDAQYPDKLLRMLAQETNLPFTQLNTCASGPANAPLDYYVTVMQKNLELLEKYFVAN